MSCDIRQIELPSKWPDPPRYMSFSALQNIEKCPRQWALSHGEYPGLWSGRGYPAKIHQSAIAGQVIHNAIETVLKDAKSLEEGSYLSRMTTIVRSVGGLSSLIDLSLSRVLDGYEDNPRMVDLVDQYRSGKLKLPSTIRTSLQSLLQKISDVESTPIGDPKNSRTIDDGSRKALSFGLFAEIILYAENSDWFGKVDILNIGPEGVAIEDIKTGSVKEIDREQLLTYGWLWWRDQQRNPQGRLATRLTIRYTDSSVEVSPLNEADMLNFEQDLFTRTDIAVAEFDKESFEARPDIEVCRYCSVRQLCDVYWANVAPSTSTEGRSHGDAECELLDILSRKTWRVRINTGSVFEPGTIVLLRGSLPESLAQTGSIVRVLDAKFIESTIDQSSEEAPIIQLLARSELFFQPSSHSES